MRTVDRPSGAELDQLGNLLLASPLDRAALNEALRHIEEGLREWADELGRTGGLLDEADKAARPSLAREDERLREEMSKLLRDVQTCRRETATAGNDDRLRECAGAVLASLRGHRDAEASLVLESADTEVGAGD